MTEEEYKEFNKRYDKFKKNNLPTPFFDEERQTMEYVYYLDEIDNQKELMVNDSLIDALGDIAGTGFYYSFTSRHLVQWKENGKIIRKSIKEHTHAHSFEEVIMALYHSPESFNISKEEEKYYSEQELNYIRRVQKYLLFIGMKDIKSMKVPVSRYQNKIHTKYENALIHQFSNELINDVINKKRNFNVIDWYPEYSGDRKFKQHEFQALIVDEEDNFKMFIEYTKIELKTYKDIKDIYVSDKLKDEDKVILRYFKVLKLF